MSTQKRLRNPLKNARGLGSAKDGTGHFILQRITAIALIFLSIYAVGLIVSLIGDDYASVHATVANPCNAILLIAFSVAMFWHAKLGIQVIIEDYVHTPFAATALYLLNIFVCALAAIACVLAVVRIALGA
jgi:succinate dehydrogenase / fumarate reductase membrane anchor subunit